MRVGSLAIDAEGRLASERELTLARYGLETLEKSELTPRLRVDPMPSVALVDPAQIEAVEFVRPGSYRRKAE